MPPKPQSLEDVVRNVLPPEILKLQFAQPVVSPLAPYTFVERTKHRATMTPGPHGVDVVMKPAPNRPASAYNHFMVPWHNIIAVFYELERPAAVATAEATLGD